MRLVQQQPGLLGSICCHGYTVLWDACEMSDLDIINYLLDQGGTMMSQREGDETVLHQSCRMANVKVVELLMARGADPTARCGENRMTPLMVAAEEGATTVARSLLKNEAVLATIDAQNSDGKTALHLACCGWDMQGVTTKALLDKGADPTMTDNDGHRAKDLAQQKDFGRVVKAFEVSVNNVRGACLFL